MPKPTYDRILVTGGSGFLGRHLVHSLISDGHRPMIASRRPEELIVPSGVDRIDLDLTDAPKTVQFISSYRPQIVIHLAGVTGHEDPTGKLCDDVNFTATANLLNALIKQEVDRVILIGSAAEYGNQPIPFRENMPARPVSPYGISKAKATEFALRVFDTNGLPVTILRLFSAWGPWQPSQMFLSQLITHGVLNHHFSMSDGKQMRDFVYVNDVTEAIRRAMTAQKATGRIINIGSGRGTALKDVALSVWDLCDGDPKLLKIGSRRKRGDDGIETEADISLAREILNWVPRYHIMDFAGGQKHPLSEVIALMRAALKSSDHSKESISPSDTVRDRVG